MGQAKKRGNLEARIQQPQEAAATRALEAQEERARQQAKFDAERELLTDDEKAHEMELMRARRKRQRSIFGLLGATSMLLAAGQTARPRR